MPSIETAARALGLQLVSVTLESERHLDAAFARIVATGAGAMLFGGGPVLRSQLDQVVALAARHAIPTIYELRDYVEAGGLISYAASFTGAYRQAGIYAGRILKGAKPSELPVLQPTKFELVDQSQDRQGARPRSAADAARPRRRGDRMKRREFITLLGGAAAAWPLAARAQQGQRMRRIGVLMGLVASDPEAQSRVAAFEHGLRELGWVKGRNLWIEYRWAGGGENELRNHAAELLAMAPDLILANSTPVTAALREQSQVVPIVFTQVTDPVGQGLVPNLAHPGGNLTGFTSFEFSIGTKWLQALKQTAPHVTRVALVFNPHSAPFADLFLRPVEAAAPSFSVTPIAAAVRATDDLDRVFDALAREANGGLIVLSDLGMTNHRDALIALAAHHRVPAVYPFRYFATSGGLMSYGTDVAEVFRRAAAYVDHILRGTSPGDLPVQAPTKYDLVINLKTARALGLTVPATLLARADEVIE